VGNPKPGRFRAAAEIALAVEGVLALSLAPQIVLGLEHSKISTANAGYCLSLNFGTMMLGSIVVLFAKNRLSAFAWALLSLTLLITGYLCAARGGLSAALVGLTVNGLGAGFTSIAFAYLASGESAGRNFAIYNFASIVVVSAVGYFAAGYLDTGGIAILFYFCAVAGVAALPLMWSLPRASTPEDAAAIREGKFLTVPQNRSVPICCMMLLYYTAFSAAWAYVGEFGRTAALSEIQASEYLAEATLVSGLVATAFVLMANSVLKPTSILPMLLLAQLGALTLLLVGHGKVSFVAALFCLNAFHSIIFPQNMSLIAGIDNTGRLAVLASIIQSLAFALGPALCGPVFQRAGGFGYWVFCSGGIILALFCLHIVGRDAPIRSGA
jgi:hypothetical protein